MKYLVFSLLLLLIDGINAQVFLNLDFEKVVPNATAKGWYQGGDGFSVFVDSQNSFPVRIVFVFKRLEREVLELLLHLFLSKRLRESI